MTTTTIINPKSGKEYTLTINSQGKAAGCSCNQKKALEAYSPFAKCQHMKDYDAPKPVVVVDQYPTLGSCDTCGHFVKKGVTTCSRCLGF